MNQKRRPPRRVPRWPWVVIFLWGLVPLLWFRGTLLVTEDLRLPAGLAEWARTLSVWNPMIGAGTPAPLDTSLVVFQAIPALWRALEGSLVGAQQVSFVWWFLLAGVGIYTLASRMIPGTPWAWLVATSFYLFNPWLDQVWLGFKPPLVAGYAVVPFVLALLLDAMRRRRSLAVTLTWLSLLSWIGASVGNNVSETLAVALPVALFAAAIIARDLVRRDRRQLAWDLKVLTAAVTVMGLTSAFWVLPQTAAVIEQVRSGTVKTYESASRIWLAGVSTHTGLLNVLRFQGDWTWYDGFGGDPYRTYAIWYAKHPLYLVLSWIIPTAAIGGILYGRSVFRFFLTLLIGVGVFSSMGVHPPFGIVYGWLVEHVPLFWIIRSPYFKFMFLTCLGYALAIGLAYVRLTTWTRRSYHGAIAVAIMGLHLVYAAPFLLGKMYALPHERTRLPPNHVTIPPHVFEAAAWFNRQPDFFRIYHLPAKAAWMTTWGYAAASPILTLFSHHPEVFEYEPTHILYTQGATNVTGPVQRLTAHTLYEGMAPHAANLLRMLGVRYILHETDLIHDFYQGPGQVTYDDPAFVRAALARQEGISRGPTFGPWEVRVVEKPLPHCYQVSRATLVIGDVRALGPLAGTSAFETPLFILSSETPTETIRALLTAGAFDHVVVAPNTPLPISLPSSLPITLVASMEQLTRHVDPWQATPLAPRQGFGPPVGGALGHLWCPLRSNGTPNWTVHNPTSSSVSWHLAGTVISPVAPRSLFAYLDQQLLAVHSVAADVPLSISMPLVLSPGDHVLVHYSPNARTPGPDGQDVGFYFAEDWRVGPPAWTGTLDVPRAGPYEVQMISNTTIPEGVQQPTVRLGTDAVNLSRDPLRPGHVLRGIATVSVGSCLVSVSNVGAVTYSMFLTPLNQPIVPARAMTVLPPTTAGSVHYTIPRMTGPGWLVFNEAYHSAWVLTGAEAIHVRANGFANGYYAANPASVGPSILKFTMQRWSVAGMAISLGMTGGLVLWCGVAALVRRKGLR